MPYTNQIQNAGRMMEQFVKIVVPKGSQGNTYNAMGMAGIGGFEPQKYSNNSNSHPGTNGSYSGSGASSSSSGGWDWNKKN